MPVAERKDIIVQLEAKLKARVLTVVTGDRQGMETRIAPDILPLVSEHMAFMGANKELALFLYTPGGPNLRVDSHIYPGYKVQPYYDSLLGKVIAHGRSRDEAITIMRRALDEYVIEGVPTTIPFHQRILSDARFRGGKFGVNFVDQLLE